MPIALHIDQAGGANFEGYDLRNVATLSVGGSALADETNRGTFDVTGTGYASLGWRGANNVYDQKRNAAGTGWINTWKITTLNQLETDIPVNMGGNATLGDALHTGWGADVRVLQLNTYSSLFTNNSTGSAVLSYNVYYDGTVNRAIIASNIGRVVAGAGSVALQVATTDAVAAGEDLSGNLFSALIVTKLGATFSIPISGTSASFNSTLAVTGVSTFTGGVTFNSTVTLDTGTVGEYFAWKRDGTFVAITGVSYAANDIIVGAALGDFNIRAETKNINFSGNSGATLHGRVTSGGVFAWGTTITTSAAAGDMVLANNKSLRSVSVGGTDTYSLVSLNGSNRMVLGGTGVNAIIHHYAAPIAAEALNNGAIIVNSSTPGELIFYANSARYKVTGISF